MKICYLIKLLMYEILNITLPLFKWITIYLILFILDLSFCYNPIMKLPIFHKYFSANIAIYLVIIELVLLIPMILFFMISNMFLFHLFLLCLVCTYIIHVYLFPLCMLLIPAEFYLRKKERIVKYNIVNISLKYQKYICIITALIYITITIVGIIAGQPMTEEELRYD